MKNKNEATKAKAKISFWEVLTAIIVTTVLIGLGSLAFYGIMYGSEIAKYAWIPSLIWAVFVIGILIYDNYHPDGGQL